MAAVEDQQPVEALGADGSDEALGDGVCLRRPHRRLDDPDAFGCGTPRRRGRCTCCRGRGSGSGRPGPTKSRPRLRACWVTQAPVGLVGAAGEPDAPVCVGDEEQDVVAAQEHALDGEEVAGDDARRLRAQELAPARTRSPRRRLQLRRGRAADGCVVGETRKPSLASSPQIRRWPQRGFSRASRNTNSRTSVGRRGRPRRPARCRHFRRTSARCQRSSVRGVTRRAPRDERGR